MAGEEETILEALALVEQKWPSELLVLAPRKPERFEVVAGLIENTGRRVVRRSTVALEAGRGGTLHGSLEEKGGVLLLDSIGIAVPGHHWTKRLVILHRPFLFLRRAPPAGQIADWRI